MPTAERNNQQWLRELRDHGVQRDSALADLRAFLTRGLRHSLSGRPEVNGLHVEDVAQEALPKVLEKLDSFRGESRFTTWALTIAVHIAFTEMRRKRWKDVSLEEMTLGADFVPGSFVSESANMEKRILQERIVTTLYQAIKEKLTDKQRQVVYAELVNEAPLEEVARRMGTTRNALYKLSHDARQRLKKALSEVGLTREDVSFALDL